MPRRLYLEPSEFEQHSVTLVDERSHRLYAVLRLRAGAPLVVFDGAGHERQATLLESTRRSTRIALGEPLPALPELPVPIYLCCAFPRGGRGDWVIEKATELGVHAFVPLDSDHAVMHPGDGRLERWRRIAIEAAEQCGRAVVPAFAVAPPPDALGLVAELDATATPREAIAASPGAPAIALYVGPEGGWSPAERAAHAAAGHLGVGLGRTTLRVETAAIALLTLAGEALRSRGSDGG